MTNKQRKPKDVIKEFEEKAWQILELIKKEEVEDSETEYQFETPKLFAILDFLPPSERPLFDLDDLSQFFTSIEMIRLNGSKVADIQRDVFVEWLRKQLLSPPNDVDFYFRLGKIYNFTPSYSVGTGKLRPYAELPEKFKASVDEHNTLIAKYGEIGETPTQEDISEQWYMHIQVKAVGFSKARELAVLQLNRNINILKFVYWMDDSLPYSNQSPMDYVSSYAQSSSATYNRGSKIHPRPLIRRAYHDEEVAEITEIAIGNRRGDLVSRTLDAIDILGLADSNTPLHIRFTLAVIGLERLLLSKDDEDYLGSKLAEKVSFLIGDTKAWFFHWLELEPEEFEATVTDEYIQKHLAAARASLDRRVHNLYEKRSGFAHGELKPTKNKKIITIEDSRLASAILRYTTQKILELCRTEKLEHIADSGKQTEKQEDEPDIEVQSNVFGDAKSLDVYIRRLKYS